MHTCLNRCVGRLIPTEVQIDAPLFILDVSLLVLLVLKVLETLVVEGIMVLRAELLSRSERKI